MALGWLRWRAWAGVGRGDAAAVGVAGVAFGDMHLGSPWEAWHSVTSTSTFVSRGTRATWRHRLPLLRGRRGTYGTGLAPMARLGRSGTRGRCCGCWCGRRGIWRHAPWFHVGGVALGDIDIHLRFTWQAWYLVTSTSTFARQAFTCKHFYTQKLLHTEAFTHRHFFTQKLLHRSAFTHNHFYTDIRFYTQKLLHTDAFTHRPVHVFPAKSSSSWPPQQSDGGGVSNDLTRNQHV